MNDSSSDSGSDDVKLADSGDYNWGAIRGKYTNVPKPPGWVKSAILKGMSAASVRGAKWARGLVTIAYRESTFNKGAVNKWDSNAKAGTPSKGMFQVIDPTFKAYHAKSLPNDPFNPASSAAAAANYIESRYGDISRVQQADPNKPPKGYAVGAWEIPEDHIAQVHKGEMIIEKPKADTIRQALMRDVVNVKDAATGQGVSNRASGSGISLTFHDGSIRFVVNGAMTSGEARNAASTFANALAENKRLQELGVGL
jgi:SLT domain-containing protein